MELKKELPFFFAIPAYVWQLFFLIVPVGIILYYSFLDQQHIAFTFDNYRAICSLDHGIIIMRSLLLSCAVMTCTLIVAYPVAYYLALRARRWKHFLLFFLTLPFWTNFLILIYAWFFLLERNGLINQFLMSIKFISQPLHLSNSIGTLFLVMVYCYLPFMIMPLYTILGKMDTRLFEASADLGATGWQTFSRVTLPLSLSGIKTGAFLVLIPVFGEFAIPALVGGQKYMFAGTMIRYYFFVVRDSARGSAFTVVCAFVLAVLALAIFMGLRSVSSFLARRISRV